MSTGRFTRWWRAGIVGCATAVLWGIVIYTGLGVLVMVDDSLFRLLPERIYTFYGY